MSKTLKLMLKLKPYNRLKQTKSSQTDEIAVCPQELSINYGMPCYSYNIPIFIYNSAGRKVKYRLELQQID
jgi:hypothetical protein